MNLKQLALSTFRVESFEVPEWDATVLIREPSVLDFQSYLTIVSEHKDEPVKIVNAEIDLLITVLLSEDKTPIFTVDDKEALFKSYTLTHRRLLNKVYGFVPDNTEQAKKAKKK